MLTDANVHIRTGSARGWDILLQKKIDVWAAWLETWVKKRRTADVTQLGYTIEEANGRY